jgi:hypothetical protein
VYLAKLKDVRGLTAEAQHIEEDWMEGDSNEEGPGS